MILREKWRDVCTCIYIHTRKACLLLKSIRRMYDLCFEGRWRWTHHFLLVIWLSLLSAAPPKAYGYFLADTKAVFKGCEDHWTLQERAAMPLLYQMTVCVDVRVVVPGAWVAFSYSSAHATRPWLGLEGDGEALYAWLLSVRHRFPIRLFPMYWHRVCLRRDVRQNSFSLEVNGRTVARRLVIAQATPPSGSLWLGCRPRDRPTGALGEVELYMFRMWGDTDNHGLCEDGTVISWDAQNWGVTSPRARVRDPNLLCALTPGAGRLFSPSPEVASTTPTSSPDIATRVTDQTIPTSKVTVSTSTGSTTSTIHQSVSPSANHSTEQTPPNLQNSSVTASTHVTPTTAPSTSDVSSAYWTPVKQTTPGKRTSTGSNPVNCDISQLCSTNSFYFWMSIRVKARDGRKTEQDVHRLVSNAFSCFGDEGDAAEEGSGFIDFCQDDGQLQELQVNCSVKSNISQTTCDVLLQLGRAVSVCELQRAGGSALQQAGDGQIQASIIGGVERVGRGVCGGVEPSSGRFVRCTSASSLDEICRTNRQPELTCSLIEPDSSPATQTRTDSCSSEAPRFCDCSSFCKSASQFFALRININSASVNVNLLKQLLSAVHVAPMCGKMSGSVCQDILNQYKRVHLECHGTQNRLYSCMVILEMSGPVNGCSLNKLMQQVIDSNSDITNERPLTRMVVCGPPGSAVRTLLASNLTWVASDLQTSDVCKADPTLLKCEANESLAVLLTDSCPPESSNLTTNNNVTTTPGASTPSVTNTTGQSHTTAANATTALQTNASQGTAQPNMTTVVPTINSTQSSTAQPVLTNMTVTDNTTVRTRTENTELQNTTAAPQNITDFTATSPVNSTLQMNSTAPMDVNLNTTTLSPNTNTAEYNLTTVDTVTPSANHTTVQNVTMDSTLINRTIVLNVTTVTPSTNHTTLYNVTRVKSTTNDTTVNNETTVTPSTNFTTLYNETTVTPSTNFTTLYNETTVTPSTNHTTAINVTTFTPTTNDTTEYNETTAANNYTTTSNNDTTACNETAPECNRNLNNSTNTSSNATVATFTPSPNDTTAENATTVSYNHTNNITTTTVSHNQTTADNVTTAPIREPQQNTTAPGGNTTTGQVNVTSIVVNTTTPTVNNHTTAGVTHNITTTDLNFTTAVTVISTNQTAGISLNVSSTASSPTTDSNLTTTEPGLTTTVTNSTLEATTSTTATTVQINTTTAEVSLNSTTLTGTTTSNPATTTSQETQDEQADELLGQTQDASQFNSSQVAQLVGNLEKLLDGPSVSQAVGQKAVNVISNLMDGNSQALSASANRLIRLVDNLGLKLVVAGDREILSAGSLVLAVRKVDGTNFPLTNVDIFNTDNVQLRVRGRSRSKRSGSALGSVSLPSSLTSGLSPEQQQQASRVQFTFYTKSALFQDASLKNQTLVSPVLAASVANLSISNLRENIEFTIRNINPVHGNYVASCAFWDFSQNGGGGGWSSAGCSVVNTTAEETTCSCNHLTSFAILLDLSREGIIDRQHAQILTFITYIGCGISAIFLAVTLLTYLAFPKLLRDIPAKILVQLCLSLLFLNLVFLLDGWLALYPAIGLCISTAFFLHYFLLTSFTWAGLEALHMYLSIVQVFTPYLSRYMLKFSLIGWGIPLLVVIIVIAVDKDNYGLVTYGRYLDGTSDDFCWLRNDIAFYVGVVAYFLLIFALCLLVFIVVMVQLSRIKKQNPQNQPPNRGVMTDLRSIAGLIVLLGLTWGFALFAWGPLYLPFVYLFSIFNSLQGFLVFVFHCAVKENVRRQWRTYLCCGKLRLAENSEWSRTATQNNRVSVVTATTSAPYMTSQRSSVISDATTSSDSVFVDSGISDGSTSDTLLNDRNSSP